VRDIDILVPGTPNRDQLYEAVAAAETQLAVSATAAGLGRVGWRRTTGRTP
jgi:hypothetical protein